MDGFLEHDAVFLFVGMAGKTIPVLTGKAGNPTVKLLGDAVGHVVELPARRARFPVQLSVPFVLAWFRRESATGHGLGNRRNEERM